MKYYGYVDIQMLFRVFNQSDVIGRFYNMKNEMKYEIPQNPFEQRMKWEKYVSTIPYIDFVEINLRSEYDSEKKNATADELGES